MDLRCPARLEMHRCPAFSQQSKTERQRKREAATISDVSHNLFCPRKLWHMLGKVHGSGQQVRLASGLNVSEQIHGRSKWFIKILAVD